MKNKKFRKSSIFVLLLATLVLTSCSLRSAQGSTPNATQTGKVSTITMSDTIDTSGEVDVDLIANLTWKTSGTVESVKVKVGQKVTTGQTLASLASDSMPANIITARSDLASAQIALDNLLNSSLPRAEAQANLANAQDALDTAKDRRESKSYQRAAQYTIDQAYANFILAQEEASKWEQRYDTVDNRPESDPERAAAFSAWAEAKQKLDQTEANLRYLEGKPDDMEIAIADGNLVLAQAQYDEALREWNRLKDGPDENDIQSAQARIDAAQATVNSQYIIAPFDGEVLSIETIPGSQVNNGAVAIVIADRSTMQVDALVDELDIFRVQLGNPVEITLDALPDVVINGSISAINPVGSTINGLVKYTVTISIDKTSTQLYFGSTANVSIMVSEPQDRQAVPLSAIKNDSEGEYVLRQNPDGSTERVNIQSYEIIEDLVIVTGSLKTGDTLQLTVPTESINAGPGGMFGG
jgi:HlyD family secretion protein